MLLDNQAQPGIYRHVTLGEIFEKHVKPYGLKSMLADSNPTLEHFFVGMGASEWHVLELFCRRTLSTRPRINVDGVLDLRQNKSGRSLTIHNAVGGQIYSELSVTTRRQGRVSCVYLKGKDHRYNICVPNLSAMGNEIQTKRYLEIPREYEGDGLKYTKEYMEQKEQSCFFVDILMPRIVDVCVADKVNFLGNTLRFPDLVVVGVEQEMNGSAVFTKLKAHMGRG
jgi:hypothetical protein